MLFIDEIHRLQPTVEEILYPAMEDYKLDLMIGEGPAARSIRLDLPPFTLVGATTRTGLLTTPLRDRFGIVARLEFYEVAELEAIVLRGARLLGLELAARGARTEIARRARGTPRVATRLLRRVRDFATVDARGRPVDAGWPTAPCASSRSTISGLDSLDRRYLRAIALNYGGGPVGIDTMAAALSEQRDTLEETVEPFLLQQGLLQRTPRGRLLTRAAWRASRAERARPRPARTADLFERRRAVTAAHELPVRVYYEDTDAAGIVYHANYLKFAERGRTEFLRSARLRPPRLAAEHGLVFAVARVHGGLRPPGPARRPAPRADRGRGPRRRADRDGAAGPRDGEPVARLAVTLACWTRGALRPTRLPEALRQRLRGSASVANSSETINQRRQALLLTADRATTIRASAASGASIEHLPNMPIIRPSPSCESRPNRTRTGSHRMHDDRDQRRGAGQCRGRAELPGAVPAGRPVHQGDHDPACSWPRSGAGR